MVKSVKILFVIIILLCSTHATGYAREYVTIGGSKVALSGINLTTDFHVRGNTTAGSISYSFYLDQRDLKIADTYRDRYLNGRSSYKVMAAIILLYVEDDFKNYQCQGKNKCVKYVNLSVSGFFNYLNSRTELRTKFLDAWTSTTMFAPKFRSRDEFMFNVALDVGYALYGISYMKVDSIYARTLLDKMVYSIRADGYNGAL